MGRKEEGKEDDLSPIVFTERNIGTNPEKLNLSLWGRYRPVDYLFIPFVFKRIRKMGTL